MNTTKPDYKRRTMTPDELLAECGRLIEENTRLQKRKPIPPGGIGLTNAELRRVVGALQFLAESATIEIEETRVPLKNCGAFRTLLRILAEAQASGDNADSPESRVKQISRPVPFSQVVQSASKIVRVGKSI
jgi:hypothetical protein